MKKGRSPNEMSISFCSPSVVADWNFFEVSKARLDKTIQPNDLISVALTSFLVACHHC